MRMVNGPHYVLSPKPCLGIIWDSVMSQKNPVSQVRTMPGTIPAIYQYGQSDYIV